MSSQSPSSSLSTKKKNTNYKCKGCNSLFLTNGQLIDHMTISLSNICSSFIVSCEHCGKKFSNEHSLNRHYAQMASCRLTRDKPDIASFLEYDPRLNQKRNFINIQTSSKTKFSNATVPPEIHIDGKLRNKNNRFAITDTGPHQKLEYYLKQTDSFLKSSSKDLIFYIRLDPNIIKITPTKTSQDTLHGIYDQFLFKVIQSIELTEDLCSEDGLYITECILDQINVYVGEVVDCVVDSDSSYYSISSSFRVNNHYPQKQHPVSEGDIHNFFCNHLQIVSECNKISHLIMELPQIVTDVHNFNELSQLSYQNPGSNSNSQSASSEDEDNDDDDELSAALLPPQNNHQEHLVVPPIPPLDTLSQCKSRRLAHQSQTFLTSSNKANIALFDILNASGIPIGVFDKVNRWAHSHANVLQKSSITSRETFLKTMREKVYGFKSGPLALEPSTQTLTLASGTIVSVTAFPLIHSLVSMLSNKELMVPANIILDHDDPTTPPPENGPLADINSGRWYKDTWTKLCTDNTKDVLLNIIGFSDETVTEKYGKQNLHPLSITLGILNRKTRNLANSWFHLGYFPKLNTSKHKLQDKHDIYSYLMKDIKTISHHNGFSWDLEIDGVTHPIVFKPAIQFIIGDCEGHDEICGRKKGHSLQMHGLCRDCDCLVQQADDPNHDCHFLQTVRMETMSKDNLADIGFHKIDNAFYNVELGSNPGGIFNATPPEHLHQYAGLCDYMFEHFESVLSGASRKIIDSTAKSITTNYSRQSERGFHDLVPFRDGVFTCSSLTSKEKVARVFILYLCLLTPSVFLHVQNTKRVKRDQESQTNSTLDPLGRGATTKWLTLFEAMLVYDSWARMEEHSAADIRGHNDDIRDSHTTNFDSPCMNAIRSFMHLYKGQVKRTTGTGLKLTKFHQLLHNCRTISEHGSLLNVDSGRPESTHKVLSKDPSKKTQKRKATLIEQTAKRLSETIAVNDAKSTFIPKHRNVLHLEDLSEEKKFCGSKFVLDISSLGHNFFQISVDWNGKMPTTPLNHNMCESIMNRLFFHVGVGGCLKEDSIVKGFTEYKPEHSKLFRAHPCYLIEEPWMDWALVEWDDSDDPVPAKIFLFLDLKDAKVMTHNEHLDFCLEMRNGQGRRGVINDGEDYPYLDNGKWAVIQTAMESEDLTQRVAGKPPMKMCRRFHLEPKLRIVPIESVRDKAFCVLDDPSNVCDNNLTGHYLRERGAWGPAFKTFFD